MRIFREVDVAPDRPVVGESGVERRAEGFEASTEREEKRLIFGVYRL